MQESAVCADSESVRIITTTIASALALGAPGAQAGSTPRGSSEVAALQVALRAVDAYRGSVDGRAGAATTAAVVAFQRRAGLTPDGIPGPLTRRALGPLGQPELGTRRIAAGVAGWDVAELQFLLAWHGFPSGTFDGRFGPRLEAAVRRFQRHAGLPEIGVAGPRTLAALRSPPPPSPRGLLAPVQAPPGDGYGPRGDRFHTGLDLLAAAGTPVAAARDGIVAWAGPRGSYGDTVLLAHGGGVRTLYAHLSRIDVDVGRRVSAGTVVGLVGATGRSTGPHLHFEVRVRGAAIDPWPALAGGG